MRLRSTYFKFQDMAGEVSFWAKLLENEPQKAVRIGRSSSLAAPVLGFC
jgi:hypothetical protein